MNSAGETLPRVGWRQRISVSNEATSPRAMSTIGWKTSENWRSAMAVRMSSSSRRRCWACWSISSSNTITVFRPLALES